MEYVVYAHQKVFGVGKIKSFGHVSALPVGIAYRYGRKSELKTIDVSGTNRGSPSKRRARNKRNRAIRQYHPEGKHRASPRRDRERRDWPNKERSTMRSRTSIRRALTIQPQQTAGEFPHEGGVLYQKTIEAAANAFREAVCRPFRRPRKSGRKSEHLYLGEILLLGQRERAVNEYATAKQTNGRYRQCAGDS